MDIKKLKSNYKAQTKPQTNQQIKNHKKSHELKLIRPQTQDKTPEHMYLNS
jgi:hypothetical protein